MPILAPGDIVVMDNLGSHKGHAVRAAIRAAKAKLFFLPAYSPDLNPIEQAFAKMKTLLRKADARTIEADLANHRRPARLLHPDRMRKLLQKRRICFSLTRSRSSTKISWYQRRSDNRQTAGNGRFDPCLISLAPVSLTSLRQALGGF